MATTPVDPRVVKVMQTCLTLDGDFGNPASRTHIFGLRAKARVEAACAQVAALVGAQPDEIIWTSGATESINLALKGAARFYQRQGKHIITMSTEHKAVLDSCAYLATEGFEITYLNPESNGLLPLEKLRAAIRSDTILASIMHVNNETGVIQDIAAIAACLKEKGVLFHVDAAQSVGKLSIDFKALPVDLLSLASHKIYGPKGIGALVVRRRPRVQLVPLLHGGDQLFGLRAGTLPTHQIVGMGMAFELAQGAMSTETKRITQLRNRLWGKLQFLEGVHLNGDLTHRVCGCLNFSIDEIDGQKLIGSLTDIAVSQGSACNAADPEPSHVLMAMGLSRSSANSALRVSVGRFTTEAEVDQAAAHLAEKIQQLRAQ